MARPRGARGVRSNPDDFTLDFREHPRAVVREEHVDLGAHAEPLVGQVDAGLDREAEPRDERPRVVRLEVVEVRAVAVDAGLDGMAGAVDELLPEAGRLDDAAD